MKHFTIDNENNITVHANRQAARDTGAGVFSTEVQFADLIGPENKRLLEIWNSLPGVKPVTKFTNRKIATERIWKAIQNLGGAATPGEAAQQATPFDEPVATAGAQGADVAPTTPAATKKATRAKKAPKTPRATQESPTPREGSKTAKVIAMLRREGGTTLEEIMAEMGWQKHTTRAMLSAGGSLTKKFGLAVASTKAEGGERTYSIAS